jgi:hypothetical protein
MAIDLPSELADLLNELGYIWPKSEEDKLFELGQVWTGLGPQLRGVLADAEAAARRVWTENSGDAVEAFRARWSDSATAAGVLRDGAAGAEMVGAALMVCAAAVLALKITVITQLSILAIEIFQAVATAPETFGASLLELPVFKKLADLAINFAVSKAMEAVLG